MPAMASSWERTWSAAGWAKMVRIAAATISLCPRNSGRAHGAWRTRQHCQDESNSTALMAALRLVWASEMTSWVPASPAKLEGAKEGGLERAVRGIADGGAEHLAAAVVDHAGGDDDGLGDHPAVDPSVL